ncbi:hypothetical protein ACQ4PT_047361 [Festuca glaucescens]
MGERVEGTVKWFNVTKGFGFITLSNGGDDIFVHQSAVKVVDGGYRSLNENDIVEYTIIEESDGRAKASDVIAPGGGALEGAMDAFSAFHNMISNVMNVFPDILSSIDTTSVTGARVQMIDVTGEKYSQRKCVVTVYCSAPTKPSASSVIISEIIDNVSTSDVIPDHLAIDENSFTTLAPPAPSVVPTIVNQVRRNKRIADLSVGYKNPASASAKSMEPSAAPKTKKKICKSVKKNLNQ